MATLKIRIKAKVFIIWGTTSLAFTRDVSTSKNTTVSYSNATGKSFASGEILYASGTPGTSGYIAVKSTSAVTLNGNGSLNLTIDHYPSATEGNKSIVFDVDGSPMTIGLSYNSQPSLTDIIIDTPNKTDYVFKITDFSSHYSDYDSDAITSIQINGDVTGYKISGTQYISGTWVAMSDINSGLLVYSPLDQTTYYEKDNTWKAKDAQGNISVN